VDELGLLRDQAQFAQGVIGLDIQRPDLRPADDWSLCFHYRHAGTIIPGDVLLK
jgi:hypothetical protein